MTRAIEKPAPPLAYLLACSDASLGNFTLARMSEMANLRADMLALFDRIVDVSAQTVLAAWLRTIDRQELKAQLLQAPDARLEELMTRAKQEIRDHGRSQEETGGPMPSPWLVRERKYLTDGERRAGRSASEKRSRERRIAKGLCERCSQPLAHHSVRECDVHLEIHRQRNARDRAKKGIMPGTAGRQPGTLKALKEANEKRKARPSR